MNYQEIVNMYSLTELRMPYTTKVFLANNNRDVLPDYGYGVHKRVVGGNTYFTIAEWQERQELESWGLAQALGLASTPKNAVLEMHGMA